MTIRLDDHDSNMTLSRNIVKLAREKSSTACDFDKMMGRVLRRIFEHDLIDEELREFLVDAIEDELNI